MINTDRDFEQIPPAIKRNWGWLLALGILFVLLGSIGLWMVVGLTLISVVFLGGLLIIAGLIQLIDAFSYKRWKGMIWHASIGLFYICGGGLIIYDPVLASTTITALLAIVLMIIGVTRIGMGMALRDSRGWGWLLVSGIAAITLGGIILAHWPWSGLWVIGLLIAIEMIITGWTYILLAFGLRNT